ncbi:MAG: hypothetical protein JXR91_13620 [Deltaproteobacteria bacterium]|nr:hypothetical protein [Deltaproteobacteria bacterium]
MSKIKVNLLVLLAMLLTIGVGVTACNSDENSSDDTEIDTESDVSDTDSDTDTDADTDTDTDTDSDTDTGEEGIPPNCDDTTKMCVISGTYVEDLTLTADWTWVLRGGVFIGDDTNKTVLTIEAGTTILGENSTDGMLVIRRHSQIMAEGTKMKPIVFTSSKAEGSRARGDWGGLIINGLATINSCGGEDLPCEASGEGGTGWYGGDDDADNSGVLKYVRVEFAGRLISPDNELNGVAFQGVGSGTTVDYLQVHYNADDGIEFFGGTANVKHVYLTGNGDDNIDWTDGWRGKAQFVVVVQAADAGDQGIEADNNGENNTYTPVANPTLSNITLVGSGTDNSDIGILLREGTMATLNSVIVSNFDEAGIDIDHDSIQHALDGDIKINYTIVDCGDHNFKVEDAETPNETIVEDTFNAGTGNIIASAAVLKDVYVSTGEALGNGVVPSDSFFDDVDFIGAVSADDNWVAGWTQDAAN